MEERTQCWKHIASDAVKGKSELVAFCSRIGLDLAKAVWPSKPGLPGLKYFVFALVRAGEDTEENFVKLFGSYSPLQELHKECRVELFSPAPSTSPVAMMIAHMEANLLPNAPFAPRPMSEGELKEFRDKWKTVIDFKRTMGDLTCQVCGVAESANEKLKKCGACHLVYYCSLECQRRDWPVHKSVCTRIKK